MTPNDLQEQLTKYLIDVHAIEQQALAQMHVAPGLSGDEQIAETFRLHLSETEQHEHRIRELLSSRGASPSKVKDVMGMVTGHGFGLFAAFQPDTPGKLVVHAYSYEHMEEGAYDMLGTIATRAGDEATLEVARQIEAEEHAMGDRLDALFDRATDVVLSDLKPGDLDDPLNAYLTDAHAIEVQSMKLLESTENLDQGPELANVYRQQLSRSVEHEHLIDARLKARGGEPSMIKDAALRLGGLNWGGFFTAQPDTPAKVAVFLYAFEHLKIASYEMLKRVAQRAGDSDTVDIAERFIVHETDTARIVRALFSEALDASLSARDLA
jgi:ferritin-like metal-binding protein YciE